MLQARLLAEHAAFKSTRIGSLSQGSCERMKHAALLTLLPAFTRTDAPNVLAQAFADRIKNKYAPARDSGHDGTIVWLDRRLSGEARAWGKEDLSFDDPDRPEDILTLEVALTFWYPMRIPFANWVIARTMLAAWGLGDRTAINPLMVAQTSTWTKQKGGAPASMTALALAEFAARTGAPTGTYVFPIRATAAMRMMTPPRRGAGWDMGLCP
jgi:hypothetical protein